MLMVEQNARRALAISDRGYVLDGGPNRFRDPGASCCTNPEVVDLYLGGPGTEVVIATDSDRGGTTVGRRALRAGGSVPSLEDRSP